MAEVILERVGEATILTIDRPSAHNAISRSVMDELDAVLNGHVIGGGGEVAIACDFRLAADDIRARWEAVAEMERRRAEAKSGPRAQPPAPTTTD